MLEFRTARTREKGYYECLCPYPHVPETHIMTVTTTNLVLEFRSVDKEVILEGYCNRDTDALTLDYFFRGTFLGTGSPPLPIEQVVSVTCRPE